MRERVFQSLIGRDYVASRDDLGLPGEDGQIVPGMKDADVVSISVCEFMRTMFDIPQVEGLAFLAEKEFPPTSLQIEVLMQLEPQDEVSDEAFKKVIDADGELAERMSHIMPGGVGVIDTSGENLDSLKENLKKEWADDPTLKLLGFVTFNRAESSLIN